MTDTAKGPAAGYLFQFEKGLLLLSSLESEDEYITIEEFDDISSHDENGTIMFTIQAKHSISSSGSIFEDTSNSLWRTLQIWVEKVESGIFTAATNFVCSTNKTIPTDSLIRFIVEKEFPIVIKKIEELLVLQNQKLAEKIALKPTSGSSIKKTILLIELVLSKRDAFKIVKEKIKIEDNQIIKEKFLAQLHVNSNKYSSGTKDNIYHTFYGWITLSSKALWNHSLVAKFTQKFFVEQWATMNLNSSIVNSIFRTKESLGSLSDEKILEKQTELFVTQIEDIPRRKKAKEQIVRKAIQEYIFSDLEEARIIKKGEFMVSDFLEFKLLCKEAWQKEFNRIVVKELNEYTPEEKVSLAIEMFDKIMDKAEIKFKGGYAFTTTNEYFRNGNFLKLSNEPSVGWHPDWESKYIKK